MKRLFVKGLRRAILWTALMFGFFSFLSWARFGHFYSKPVEFWLATAAVMTLLTMISMPLDEAWAKRRDHAKRMKERDFQ